MHRRPRRPASAAGPPPRVSVVVPAYDAAAYVGAAVTGGLTQTHPDVQVVVVDDGSSDETAAVVAAYGDRVRLVRRPNGGPSAARNAGIRAADGDLVCLCDADDVLLPGHVAAAVAVLAAAGPRTWVSSEAALLTPGPLDLRRRVHWSGMPRRSRQPAAIVEANFVSIFSLFPRAMFEEVGGFDETLGVCEDWDFWMRAIAAGWRVAFQPRPHALYRLTPGSLSTDDDQMARGQRVVLRRALDRLGDQLDARTRDDLAARLDHPTAIELGATGDAALRRRDYPAAGRAFARASRLARRDTRLRVKAWSLRAVPPLGWYWRRRLLAADQATGRSHDVVTGHARRRTE